MRDLYPDSLHVRDIGLDSIADSVVWEYAKLHEFVIVTKDSDFVQLSSTLGYPPKVIWLRVGNVPAATVVSLLRNRYVDIRAFCQDAHNPLLVLP